MVKVFLIVAISISVGATYLAFQTHEKLQKAAAAATEAHQNNKQSQAALAERYKQLTEVQDLLAKFEERDTAIQAQLNAAKVNATTLKDQVAQLQSHIDSRDAQIQQLSNELLAKKEEVQKLREAHEANVSALASLQELQTSLAEKNALIEKLQNDAHTYQYQLKAELAKQQALQRPHTNLSGKVIAVNYAWNFVVISLGHQNGMVINTEMLIKRGDTPIGKARVTSVEPSTSIAEIIPKSTSTGVIIHPGDLVVWN